MLRNSRTPQDAPAVNSGGWVRYWWPIFDCQKWQSRSGNPPNESRCGLVVKYGEFPSLKSNNDCKALKKSLVDWSRK